MKVREKYQGLSRQELLDKVSEVGMGFGENCRSGSQSTVAAFHEILDIDDIVVKVATSSCGGQAAQILGTCGGLIGGTIVLDYFFGRPVENMSYKETIPANIDRVMDAVGVAKLLYDRFVKEYGTIYCAQLQQQFYGRTYWFMDPEDMEKFQKAVRDLYPKTCFSITRNVTRWVMEMLLDKGVVEL